MGKAYSDVVVPMEVTEEESPEVLRNYGDKLSHEPALCRCVCFANYNCALRMRLLTKYSECDRMEDRKYEKEALQKTL